MVLNRAKLNWRKSPFGRESMKPVANSVEYRLGEVPGTKWVVRGKLGEGGMGIVLDVVKANVIQGAMKVLHPSMAMVPELASLFLEEVKVTAQLQHPNIVQVLDFDCLQDGTPFMVMERLRGRTLRAALRETRQRGRVWAPANTYAVAAQVCEGLSRAHSHSVPIVHRDIKPENIYLHRADGSLEPVVKVMDFGVAAVAGQRDGACVGTPRYMAPEQLRGERVSPQTDQYALALVIYEMLTDRWPWDVDVRDLRAMARMHLSVSPAPPATFCAWLPKPVDAALVRALCKDPSGRHESMHEFSFELRPLQWADQPGASSGETPATYPTVGTIADGFESMSPEPSSQEGESISALLDGLVSSSAPGYLAGLLVEPCEDKAERPGPASQRAPLQSKTSSSEGSAWPSRRHAADAPIGSQSPKSAPPSRVAQNAGGKRIHPVPLWTLAGACTLAVLVGILALAKATRFGESHPGVPAQTPAAGEEASLATIEVPALSTTPAAQDYVGVGELLPRVARAATSSPNGQNRAGNTLRGDRQATPAAEGSTFHPVRAPRRRETLPKDRAADDGRDELYVPGTP
jgi:serine/threonine protein kinase